MGPDTPDVMLLRDQVVGVRVGTACLWVDGEARTAPGAPAD